MLNLLTRLKISDNSKVKKITIINNKKKYIGDFCTVTIKKSKNTFLKKGTVTKCLITLTKKEILRKDGSWIKADYNTAIVFNNKNMPQANRILNPTLFEIKYKKKLYKKLLHIYI